MTEEGSPNGAKSQQKIRDNVLEIFRKLSGDNEKVLVRHGVKLLRHLTENRGDENSKNELKYTLCRLIRGLGASSNLTKQGFYTVLVGLLSCVDNVEVSELLEVADKELHTSSGNSKSENADVSAGQILLCGAIIRTGLFERADGNVKKTIVEKLLVAGKKRSYLYLLAATFINQLCNNVDEDYFKLYLWPILSPELSRPWPEQNVDSLYLLFVTKDRFPSTVNKKYFKTIFGAEDLVSVKNLGRLADILINMPRLETANHPIYDLLCKSLSQEMFAVPFVREADKLLTSYNYNRHTIFTLMLTSIVKNLQNVHNLPNLITANYMRHTIQYFKTAKRSKNSEQLQRNIYDLFNAIVESLKKEEATSETKVDLIRKLLFDPGTFIFEKLTGTKLIQQVIFTLNDGKGVKAIAEIFKEVILSESLNNHKVYAAQLFVKLLSHDAVKEDFTWKIDQIKFLMELGFVDLEKYSNIGNELSGCFRQCFYKALTAKHQSFHNVRIAVWELSQHLNPYVEKSILRFPLQDEMKSCWNYAYSSCQEIQEKPPNQLNHIYQTLFSFLGFHAFQDPKLAAESVKELRNCYDRVHSLSNDTEEPHFSEVMLDLFLCLLSHHSSLFRNLVGMVFSHFARSLTNSAFHQILDALDPENKDVLSETKSSDGSESDEDSESSDESDDDSEAEPISEKLREAVQMALGEFGDEEIDLDEMSDSEGLRLDEALASAFKHNKVKKPKRQSRRDNLKMNFRIRVLDLIDTYFENEPSISNCIESIPTLLKLEEFAIRDPFQSQLLERVTKSIKKLSALKKFTSIEYLHKENNLREFLSFYLSLFDDQKKNVLIVQAMRESISHLCAFFIRCAQHIPDCPEKNSVSNITTIALESYFLRRNPPIPFKTFRIIIRTNHFGLYDLIRDVLPFVYLENLKLFKKIEALELARDFFKNHRFLTTHVAPNDFEESLKGFLETTRNILEYSVENRCLMEKKFLHSLLDFLLTLKKSPFNIPFGNLIGHIEKYHEITPFANATKAFYNKLRSIPNGIEAHDVLQDEIYELWSTKRNLKSLKARIEEERSRLNCKRKSEEVLENCNKKSKKSIERRSLNLEETNGDRDSCPVKLLKKRRQSSVL